MSKDSFTFHETLNVQSASKEFFDLSFYSSCVDTNNLHYGAYYLSRVTNNPDTSNKVGYYEHNRVLHPKQCATVQNLNESDIQTGAYDVVDNSSVSSLGGTSSAEFYDLALIVDDVVAAIMKETSNRVPLLKVFTYMLYMSNVTERVRHPYLNRFVREVRAMGTFVQFKDMHTYCGSAYKAKNAKNRLKVICKQVMGVE